MTEVAWSNSLLILQNKYLHCASHRLSRCILPQWWRRHNRQHLESSVRLLQKLSQQSVSLHCITLLLTLPIDYSNPVNCFEDYLLKKKFTPPTGLWSYIGMLNMQRKPVANLTCCINLQYVRSKLQFSCLVLSSGGATQIVSIRLRCWIYFFSFGHESLGDWKHGPQ